MGLISFVSLLSGITVNFIYFIQFYSLSSLMAVALTGIVNFMAVALTGIVVYTSYCIMVRIRNPILLCVYAHILHIPKTIYSNILWPLT